MPSWLRDRSPGPAPGGRHRGQRRHRARPIRESGRARGLRPTSRACWPPCEPVHPGRRRSPGRYAHFGLGLTHDTEVDRMTDKPVHLLDDDGDTRPATQTSRRIAVVGASSNPARPSCAVFATLVAGGLRLPAGQSQRDGGAGRARRRDPGRSGRRRRHRHRRRLPPSRTDRGDRPRGRRRGCSSAVASAGQWSTRRAPASPPKAAWRSSWTAARRSRCGACPPSGGRRDKPAPRESCDAAHRTAPHVLPGDVALLSSAR